MKTTHTIAFLILVGITIFLADMISEKNREIVRDKEIILKQYELIGALEKTVSLQEEIAWYQKEITCGYSDVLCKIYK